MLKSKQLTELAMNSLVGIDPKEILPHGPTKIYIDGVIWHEPEFGIIAYYTPREKDTLDHFGVYRGADQIESFGQATVVAMNAFLVCKTKNIGLAEMYKSYNFVFAEIGSVTCRAFLRTNETFIVVGFIDSYKFRQMKCSGAIYKMPGGFDLINGFNGYPGEKLKNNELPEGFELVTVFNGLIGRGIKLEKMK
jgi:hypothetical protein